METRCRWSDEAVEDIFRLLEFAKARESLFAMKWPVMASHVGVGTTMDEDAGHNLLRAVCFVAGGSV